AVQSGASQLPTSNPYQPTQSISVPTIFFFFSSRRRHTRLQGDWSSDVCSSDLRPGRLPRNRDRSGDRRAGAVRAVRRAPHVRRRSEERRVGKECRSGWWTDGSKKERMTKVRSTIRERLSNACVSTENP